MRIAFYYGRASTFVHTHFNDNFLFQPLVKMHPLGITRHTSLILPEDVLSVEARSLLDGLLQYSATDRLGSGPYGAEEIKSHSFFKQVDWEAIAEL